MTAMLHPSYTPNLVPWNVSLFFRMKNDKNRKLFANVTERLIDMINNERQTEVLSCITKVKFKKWNKRLYICININEEYFEGD